MEEGGGPSLPSPVEVPWLIDCPEFQTFTSISSRGVSSNPPWRR